MLPPKCHVLRNMTKKFLLNHRHFLWTSCTIPKNLRCNPLFFCKIELFLYILANNGLLIKPFTLRWIYPEFQFWIRNIDLLLFNFKKKNSQKCLSIRWCKFFHYETKASLPNHAAIFIRLVSNYSISYFLLQFPSESCHVILEVRKCCQSL